MAKLKFTVPDKCNGIRLDTFLRREHDLSGTTIKKAKWRKNGLTMNGEHIRSIDRVIAGAVIIVDTGDENAEYQNSNIDVEVVFEDDDIVIFNKPAGMCTHPTKGQQVDTLGNVFAGRKETAGFVYRPVGRLDRDTSGLVLVAKNPHVAWALRDSVIKKYYAIVHNVPNPAEGKIDAPIGREGGTGTRKRCVVSNGSRAVTNYSVINSNGEYSLVELILETGRTHQIRVHMAYTGCPLIGDELYGGSTGLIARQALHCYSMEIIHPLKKDKIYVESKLPDDMQNALKGILPE